MSKATVFINLSVMVTTEGNPTVSSHTHMPLHADVFLIPALAKSWLCFLE